MKKIFIVFALFISPLLQAQETYSITDIPLGLTKNANSVLLDEKVDVDVSSHGKLRYSYYAARAVLNKRGDKLWRIRYLTTKTAVLQIWKLIYMITLVMN